MFRRQLDRSEAQERHKVADEDFRLIFIEMITEEVLLDEGNRMGLP